MKFRGTTRGINVLLETADTVQHARTQLEERTGLLGTRVTLELVGPIAGDVLDATLEAVRNAGGTVVSIRPARVQPAEPTGRTEIIARTLRSGARIEVSGSVIVLGDVNSGVELIAGGDVIVLGALRGLAHAGAQGREDAIIWAKVFAAPQVRIASALARAPEGSSLSAMRQKDTDMAELARLENGQIVIEPFRA
jgi:septum site-determining protein MinC